jgi:hypothetical protein
MNRYRRRRVWLVSMINLPNPTSSISIEIIYRHSQDHRCCQPCLLPSEIISSGN